jgi:Antitoxin FitA-like, ribbon-helix-helix/Clp amino terminal domain, pathogenicity island component
MATLHVRNVPDELYELLRALAARNSRSIGEETVELLHEKLVLGGMRRVPIPGMRRRPPGQPGIFTRFTTEARQAVVAAQEEARTLGHDHVGTDHLLLGALARTDPAEAAIVRARMTPGDATGETGQIPFTPEAKRALELSLRAALAEGAPLIEARHLVAAVKGDPAPALPQRPLFRPDTAFRVVLLEGEPEAWERQLNEAAELGYELVEIVDRRAIFRR